MSKYERYGSGSLSRYGTGFQLDPAAVPAMQWIAYPDFSGGYISAAATDTIPKNATGNSLDVEVDRRGRLVVVPGTTEVELLAGRTLTQVALHASLSEGSELLFFDPPFLGVRTSGATAWQDVGLPVSPEPFSWANFGSTLIFGNGRVGTYARQPHSNAIQLLAKAPAASTYASFAGRVFAGRAIIDGNREDLGVVWSASNSDFTDWEGFGAGFELLIDSMTDGADRIVALRPMGLDFMMIGCRRSIWIATRTGLSSRPADFKSRVSGLGFVNEETVRVTRFGVLGLTDVGVALFDGNQAAIVSEAINSELLPLDMSQLDRYAGVYNPDMAQYYLFTPTLTWVYDLERRRWIKRSLQARAAVAFAAQVSGKRWQDLTGTWGEQVGAWEDLGPAETDDSQFFLLNPAGADTNLSVEDVASSSNFGVPMLPRWEFPVADGRYLNQLLTVQRVVLRYEGQGEVNLWLPDIDGVMQLRSSNYPLALASGVRTKALFGMATGLGASAMIEFPVGKPKLVRLDLGVLERGPRIENTVFEAREYYQDFV